MCYIEGQNGIGKSLAIHLLELTTGHQPYGSMPAAWASLRRSLGPVTIRVDGLEGGSATIRLEPTTWPETADAPGEWLGTIETSDGPIMFSDFWQRLRVVRVS